MADKKKPEDKDNKDQRKGWYYDAEGNLHIEVDYNDPRNAPNHAFPEEYIKRQKDRKRRKDKKNLEAAIAVE